MKGETRGGGEREAQSIKMCYVHLPLSHDEWNHYIL